MQFFNFVFQAWKVRDFNCGSWKVMENGVHGGKNHQESILLGHKKGRR